MKKSTLLMVLSLVLALALGVGGTMAYLQDTDSDVNVMTLGNVYIEQLEFERITQTNSGKDELQEFTNNEKPLYPAVGEIAWVEDENGRVYQQWPTGGSSALFDTEKLNNEVDKFVHVKNTGKSDAYFRTIFGFELADGWTVADVKDDKMIHLNINDADGNGGGHYKWTWADDVLVLEDGSRFAVATATYVGKGDTHKDGILPAGETSRPSLLQIFLDKSATNEDIASLGENYEILVVSQAVQTVGFENVGADVALNTAFNEGKLLNSEAGLALTAEWFGKAIEKYEAEEQAKLVDHWDGTPDTDWYNDTDTEFVLNTAEELAGLAKLVDEGNTFAGKTVKLGRNICLSCDDPNCSNTDEGNRTSFEPIGDASNADFSGTFDGQGNTIHNLYQDCNSKHLGLFGAVYEGTVKNLTLDGARVENNGDGYAAAVAAYTGASTFENITLKNSTVANYNHNTAGIAAWVSNNETTTTFDGINIDDTTTIASWWGSYDTRVGGIVGAMNTANYVVIKNSTIACRLDVYNDVMSNYQWHNYRMAGMVVGDVRDSKTVDGRTEADPVRVTCENVTVVFGDWANYHYCESAAYGTPSYADPGEYKFNRVEAGEGYGGVDLAACNHNEDETHNELIEFDGLFGARDGKGIYTINSFEGVTVISK